MQRVQLEPGEMRLNIEKSEKWRALCSVLNGLNYFIIGVIHDYCRTCPKSEYEQGSFRGEPSIASKECARIRTVKHVDGGFACENVRTLEIRLEM